MKSRQEWFGNIFDKSFAKTHVESFERRWYEGKCTCDLINDTKLQPVLIDIYEEPPKECPYILERMLQGDKIC
jgi:hypothetical protein